MHKTLAISRMQMASSWELASHDHPFQELVMVVEGQVETRTSGGTTLAVPGMVKLHPRGVAHHETAIGTSPVVLYCLTWEAAEGVDTVPWPLMVPDRTGRMRMLMEWMIELSPPHDQASTTAREGLLQALIYTYACAARGPSDDLVLAIRGWVRAHLTRPIYLDDLAQVAGISRYHFNRLFRKAAGRTPMHFVREMRVDAARSLLLNSAMPLREIAPMVGFADEFQLSRVFREVTGQSPASLRRRS